MAGPVDERPSFDADAGEEAAAIERARRRRRRIALFVVAIFVVAALARLVNRLGWLGR